MNCYLFKVSFSGLLGLALWIVSSASQASGFQTSYHSVSSFSRGLGGAGVSGDDLADFYYNPAALSLYKPGTLQGSFGMGNFSNDFDNDGSSRSFGGPSDGPEDAIDEDLPNISAQWIPEEFLQQYGVQFGIFVGNAFGNENEYEDDWIGRYHAIKSRLRAYDLSPTVSFPVGESNSTHVGFTLSIQRSTAELSQALIVPTMPDGKATLEGDDTAFGFAVGVVHKVGKATLGASYRSVMKHELEGDLTIENTPTLDGDYSASSEIDLPETVYLSGKFGFEDFTRWHLYWTSRWTRWSRFEDLIIEVNDPAVGNTVLPQDWDDTWLHGIGLSYQYSDKVLLRVGLTVDETPIPNAERRSPRQPEGDRTWISFGASWRLDNGGVFDVGVNHQEIDDGEINNTRTILDSPFTITDTLSGEYNDGSFTLLGIQYRHTF